MAKVEIVYILVSVNVRTVHTVQLVCMICMYTMYKTQVETRIRPSVGLQNCGEIDEAWPYFPTSADSTSTLFCMHSSGSALLSCILAAPVMNVLLQFLGLKRGDVIGNRYLRFTSANIDTDDMNNSAMQYLHPPMSRKIGSRRAIGSTYRRLFPVS